jgi:hypothetical protein
MGDDILWHVSKYNFPGINSFQVVIKSLTRGSPVVCPLHLGVAEFVKRSRELLRNQLKERDFGKCLRLAVCYIWDKSKAVPLLAMQVPTREEV